MKTNTRIRMEAAIKTILKEGQAVKKRNSSKKIVKEAGGLQLYVWQGFGTDYTDGLAFAIASSEEEAKQLVLEYVDLNSDVFGDDEWGELTVHELSTPIAGAVFGGG